MKLDKIFDGGAIFPHDKPFLIYGESQAETTVSFNGVSVKVKPVRGRFTAKFPPMPCGGPYEIKAVCGNETVSAADAYVGEILLLAGQSNVMFKVKECEDDLSDFTEDRLLRCFFADHIIFYDGDNDRFRSSDGWIECRKGNFPDFTALSYFIGRSLRKKTGVAVGVINCYEGASVIQSWLPPSAFDGGEFDLKREDMHSDHFDYDIWNARSMLYRKTFAQVKPYAVNAIVWYQGESNTTVGESKIYAREVAALAKSWRNDLGDENIPFVIVQIADLDQRDDDGWHSLQKAQAKAAEIIPNAKLVISKDVCPSDSIHPALKRRLGERIAEALR